MKPFLFIFLIFPFTQAPAAEAQKEKTLDPVVVTATRTDKPLKDVTTSITVITAEDIRKKQAETVVDILRYVPGLDVVQSGSRGTEAQVFIRGSEADQVLVLVDGVEVNSTTQGFFNFAHITTESIERIEVLRGSGGTLYGSQAIGGVIQIFTKAGRGKPVVTASVEGGNGYTNRQALTLGGKVKKLGFFLSGSHTSTDGFRPFNDDYKNIGTSVRMDLQTSENTLLKGVFQFRKTDGGLVNSNNFVAGALDPNARTKVTDYLVNFDWKQKVVPAWDYRLSGSMFKQQEKFTDGIDDVDTGSSENRFRPTILTGGFQTNYRLQEWSTSTFGFEYKNRQADTDSGTTIIQETLRNVSTYFQQQVNFLDGRLWLVGGTRYDDYESFGTEWSPSVSAAYLIQKTNTRFKLSYAQGFKAPALNELFFGTFGNPNLKAETSWEFNGGVEQTLFGLLNLGLTYFHRDVDDQIQAAFVGGSFVAQNVNKVRVDGIEAFGSLELENGLSFHVNYTHLEIDATVGSVVRRPRHRGNIVVNYQRNRFNINLATNIVGERDDFGGVKNLGYVKMDLASAYTLPWKIPGVKSLRLYGKIENLLDQDYEEANGFPSRPINFLIGIGSAFGKKEEEKSERR
jgi:vitamin B12 transporter